MRLGATCQVAASVALFWLAASPSRAQPQPPVSSSTIVLASAETGITADALAVNGLHETASTIISNFAGTETLLATLTSQRNQLSAASESLSQIIQALALDPQNQALLAQQASAAAEVQSLQQQVSESRQALFDEATDGLSEPQKQKLVVWNQSALRNVPPEFRVESRTDAQWHAIEKALIAERRAERLNQQLDTADAELLASIRGDLDVAAAAASLQAYLAGVQQLFEVATSNQ